MKLAKAGRLALIGSETLLGREIRDLISSSGLSADMKLIGEEEKESATLTEQSGEATFISGLDSENLNEAKAVFLAGSQDSSRKALDLGTTVRLIDLTHATEDDPRSRLRAPMVEPEGFETPGDAIHVVAHPAAIALALFFNRLHTQHPVRRSVAHVFEPASERGKSGLNELQQQTINLLSFKGIPKEVFDAQLSFNMLARYGEEAPTPLEDAELRIERHLATLLSNSCHAPMPSLRLIQAPVFHGYSFSLWVEFAGNPGVTALEQDLSCAEIDVRASDLEPPTNVGIAGQSGIAVGAVAIDRNQPQAYWFWMVADNLRLSGENAVAVARELL